jgi:hypothetical protein
MQLLRATALLFIAAFLCDGAAAQSSPRAPVDAQSLQCGRLDQRTNLHLIRKKFWVSRLSQQMFFEELRSIDSKVKEAWAPANVDDETRRWYITRDGTSELSPCLHANLLSGDEAWRFDQCAKQKHTGPSSCEAGLLVARRGVVIFKLVTKQIYFD